MRLRIKKWMLGVAAGLAMMAVADVAAAQGCGQPACEPPPPCCEPPPPPPPPPAPCCELPPAPPCCYGGGNVNVNVNVNAGASASASAGARAGGYINARAGSSGYYGGGSAYVSVDQPYPTTIQGLAVEGLVAQTIRTPYTQIRRAMMRVVVQAVCIDDRQVPHPASQVRPDRDVGEDYEGELYRCLAGTWLQATIAKYEGEVRFDGGETLTCRKHEALWYGRGGKLECRPEKAERDCNERSLLRRYGAGVKILTMYREEEYTEYREEQVQSTTVITGAITLDGGVGGRVF